jgi:type IV pilus assembly protein PilN
MIKINLLEVEKERRVKAAGAGGIPTSLLAIVILGGTAAAFGIFYFTKTSKLAELEKDVEQKRLRKKELEPYIRRVDELEKRRDDLAKKNHAIEELRSQRTIPVHIMDEVSRAVPEYLWLTGLSIKGNSLDIEGETLQEQAIPTLMKNLTASEFIGQTRLIETHQKATTGTQNVSTAFTIQAPVTNPFKPKEPVDEDLVKAARRTRKT